MFVGSLSLLNCLEVITFKGSIVARGFVEQQLCSRRPREEECFLLFGLSVRPKMIYADVKYVYSTPRLKVLLGAGIYLSTVSMLDRAVNWMT